MQSFTQLPPRYLQLPLLLLLLLLLLHGRGSDCRTVQPAASPLIRIECELCLNFAAVAKRLIEDGQTNILPEVGRIVCKYKFKEASQVCDGVIKLWTPMAAFAAEKIYFDPHRVCGQLLGSSCSNETIPELNAMWNLTLPSTRKPPVVPPRPPPPGAQRLRILHLSDVHIDIFYKIGARADCGLPTCCRISDGVVGNRSAAYWGDYNCDQPLWVLRRIFRQLATDRQFDLIYFTGDLPDHHVWKQTKQQQLEIYRNFTDLVREHFPGLPFVSALGNHESLPVNSFPPHYIGKEHSMRWLYEQVWESLSHWVPSDQKQNVLQGGYYTQLLQPGFRVVSLNVNYANDLNWWILQNITDPDGQLQWLVNVLQQAEDKGEKVHILGHIPPRRLLRGYSWNYFKIALRYESTITGHFYGHTHKDSFGVLFDPANHTRAFGSVYVMGSLKADNNPSYRIYSIDANARPKASWQVLDYKNYIFNLTEANAAGQKRDPQWKLEYRPTVDYKMQQTFPRDWAELIIRFERDDKLFQKFYRFYTKSTLAADHPPCIGSCKRSFICEMRNQRAGDKTFPC